MLAATEAAHLQIKTGSTARPAAHMALGVGAQPRLFKRHHLVALEKRPYKVAKPYDHTRLSHCGAHEEAISLWRCCDDFNRRSGHVCSEQHPRRVWEGKDSRIGPELLRHDASFWQVAESGEQSREEPRRHESTAGTETMATHNKWLAARLGRRIRLSSWPIGSEVVGRC